jgi:hypothetical protein
MWRECPISRAFFNMSLKFLIKFLLIRDILPLWREMSVSRAFLYITFRVPSKGTPSRFPSQSSHRERERERERRSIFRALL